MLSGLPVPSEAPSGGVWPLLVRGGGEVGVQEEKGAENSGVVELRLAALGTGFC